MARIDVERMNYSKTQIAHIGSKLLIELSEIMGEFFDTPDEKVKQLRKVCKTFDRNYNSKICAKEVDRWVKKKMDVLV